MFYVILVIVCVLVLVLFHWFTGGGRSVEAQLWLSFYCINQINSSKQQPNDTYVCVMNKANEHSAAEVM